MGLDIHLFAQKRSYFLRGISTLPLLIILLFLPKNNAQAEVKALQIGVLYPTVSREYSSMFKQLIAGIKSKTGVVIRTYRINENTTPDDIKEWSEKLNISGFIALGQQTYKLANLLDSDLPLVAGGMVATPPGISGISLSAQPEAFFRQLRKTNPKISRVFFVYSQRNNGWLIPGARSLSQKYKVEFVPLKVNDFRQATLQYQIVLNSVDPQKDAIWLPLDNVAPLNILLPEILRVSWDKKVTVFSNNLSHARRGVLFALYPDHFKQGKRLLALVQNRIDSLITTAELYPSKNLKTAVNVRTASHLNIRFSREQLKNIDQVYPAYQ